jgi:hypothetical protein
MGHVSVSCLPVEHKEVEEEQREHQPDEDQPRPEEDALHSTHAHIPFTRISQIKLAPPLTEHYYHFPTESTEHHPS